MLCTEFAFSYPRDCCFGALLSHSFWQNKLLLLSSSPKNNSLHLRLATLSLSVKINPSRSPHDKVTLRDKKDDPTSFFVVVVVRLLLLNLNVIASIVIITVITAVPCRVIAMLLEFYIPVICIMKYDILRIPIRIKPSCDARLQCTPLKTLL